MCGLIAMVSKREFGFNKNEADAFTQMLFVDQLRGKDGTGIYYNAAKDNFNPVALKAAVPASVFLETKEYEAAISTVYQQSRYIVGHNRAGTRGANEVKNTHPFREGHIMLVHNGTLFNHKGLHETYESDSKSICYSIAKRGAEETLKEVDGSFALIWADSKEKTLNFCRNSQRPLYVLETKDSYFFSSEEDLAKWILKRNNITIEKSNMLDTEKIFSISFDDTKVIAEKKVEFYKWVNYGNAGNNVVTWPYMQRPSNHTNSNTREIKRETKRLARAGFAYNSTVKFRGGAYHQHKHTGFLEGDILINQGLADDMPLFPVDFEDKFRIKVYGSEAELTPFINCRTITGVISSTTDYNTPNKNYIVNFASLRNYAKVIIKGAIKLIECDFCQKHVNAEEIEVTDGCTICSTCAIGTLYSSHMH